MMYRTLGLLDVGLELAKKKKKKTVGLTEIEND